MNIMQLNTDLFVLFAFLNIRLSSLEYSTEIYFIYPFSCSLIQHKHGQETGLSVRKNVRSSSRNAVRLLTCF